MKRTISAIMIALLVQSVLFLTAAGESGASVFKTGFEGNETNEWKQSGSGFSVKLDNTISHSGENSLKLYNEDGVYEDSDRVKFETPTFEIAPGTYSFEMWFYRRDYRIIKKTEENQPGGANIKLIPYSGSTALSECILNYNIPDIPDEDLLLPGWEKRVVEYKLSETAKDENGKELVPDKLKISISYELANGVVWLDDLSLLSGETDKNRVVEPILTPEAEVGLKGKLTPAVTLMVGSGITYANSIKKRIDDNNAYVQPVIINGRTLVPVRFISENMGAEVEWEQASQTVSISHNGKNIKLQLGSNNMLIDGSPVTLDVAAGTINGRTFIPLRALSEALGKQVFWDDKGLIVISDDSILNSGSDGQVIKNILTFLNSSYGVICKPQIIPPLDRTEAEPYPEYEGTRLTPLNPSIVLTENTREALDKALENFEFKSEGLMNTLDELQYIKEKIKAGEEPWASNFEKMKKSKWAAKIYTPVPYEIPYSEFSGMNDNGSASENQDSVAAYTQALMWIFTEEETYAKNAVRILNDWANTIQSHDGGNWYLNSAWCGSKFPLAAQLMKLTYEKWTKEEQQAMHDAFNRAYLPLLNQRFSYGNRLFSVSNALVAIGIFNEDKAAFHQGLIEYLSYLPSFIYLDSDGDSPIPANYWEIRPTNDEYYEMIKDKYPDKEKSWVMAPNKYKPSNGDDITMMTLGNKLFLWNHSGAYINGMAAEIGRDLGHTDMAIGAAINVAEMAWHQGIDIYSIFEERYTAFSELQAKLRLGYTLPNTLYGGVVSPTTMHATWEILYNHYHNRRGIELPFTKQLINPYIRSAASAAIKNPPDLFAAEISPQISLHMAWETLTHAELN